VRHNCHASDALLIPVIVERRSSWNVWRQQREGRSWSSTRTGFVAWLGRHGYSPKTCEAQVALVRHLGRWLAQQDVPLSGLGREVAGEYAIVRRKRSQLRSEHALRPVLSYLRELGAVPPAETVVPHEPVDVLLARFGGWLSRERGLAPATVSSYLYQARPFAGACAGRLGILTAARVSDLATAGAAGLRPRSAQVRANAVRALLRFAWLEGLTAVPLAGFVGSFAAPVGPAVPKGLSSAQAAEFLAFVRAAPGGLRNEPMMALLLQLALRAGEAAGLLLDDIAWRQGVITVRGKGNRSDQVPLPADVGRPLACYLRDGRPDGTPHRQVFLALEAPHAPLAQAAVTSVAGRALASVPALGSDRSDGPSDGGDACSGRYVAGLIDGRHEPNESVASGRTPSIGTVADALDNAPTDPDHRTVEGRSAPQ
jgi:integrase/recombinase XerD